MFDQLRDHFEAILILLFIASTFAYIIYQFTIKKHVKQAFADHKAQFEKLKRKDKKILQKNLLHAQLKGPLKKTIFLLADLFWVLLFVVVIRSFIFEPFIIPSGSMKPGLLVGDIIIVDKNELGYRLPISNKKLSKGTPIKRGDVLVFRYPKNPKISYIKRVIGLPGDHITYDNRKLTINNQPIDPTFVTRQSDYVTTHNGATIEMSFSVFDESLNHDENTHQIRYNNRYVASYPNKDFTVPEGQFFVMGDNRDHSADGREFGFVQENLIIGKAKTIALNYKCFVGDGLCNRFFKAIK